MRNSRIEFSNPIIKDRLEIIENSEHKLRFKTYLEPGGGQNQFHYHTRIIEKFKVISGSLNILMDNNELVLKANEEHSICPFVNHYFFNKSNKQVVFEVEIMNPKQIMYGLTNSGKTNKEGLPKNIFHTAISLRMMNAFSPKIPYALKKNGISILAFLGKKLGIEKQLINNYCTLNKN